MTHAWIASCGTYAACCMRGHCVLQLEPAAPSRRIRAVTTASASGTSTPGPSASVTSTTPASCARSTHRVSGVICVVFVWCVRSTGVVRSLWSSVWCVRKSADHSTAVCKFNVKLNLNQQKKKNAVSRIHIGCSCITRSFVLKGDETSVFFVKTTLAVEHLAFLLWSD